MQGPRAEYCTLCLQWPSACSSHVTNLALRCLPTRRKKSSEWDAVEATPAVGSRWDATPGLGGATPAWDGGATPGLGGSRWDATPGPAGGGGSSSRRNRWDDATPAQQVRTM